MKITIKNLQKKNPVYPARIKRTILKALFLEKAKNFREVCVCFGTDNFIKKMNRRYLGKNRPTDVLAFELPQADCPQKISLEIAISIETAKRNAKIYKNSLEGELNLYVVHGLLHALGYNDNTARKRRIIEARAQEILNDVYP